MFGNGTVVEKASEFYPIPLFNRTDVDLQIMALSPNTVLFANRSEDLWYRATSPLRLRMKGNGQQSEQMTLWQAEEPLWPMGCATQHQVCDPSLPEKHRCTELAGWYDIAPQFLAMSEHKPGDRARWILKMLDHALATESVVSILGSKSLTSRFSLTKSKWQMTLEPNQWHSDVTNWFSITLSSLQLSLLTIASGPAYAAPEIAKFVKKPATSEKETLCRSQVCRLTLSLNFSCQTNSSCSRKSTAQSTCPLVFLASSSSLFLA